jgi:hypothetical protein
MAVALGGYPSPIPLPGSHFPKCPAPQRIPTEQDWTALYSVIQRLYIRERRKLRYVMRYMEDEHGLKATYVVHQVRF